jgi:glutathione S-transferase
MLVLYGHPFSSYTWKALIPLYANGTPFELRDMAENIDFIRTVHPAAHIPVLTDGDAVVFEATAIVEHLAVHHPGEAPLLPTDPAEAVRMRMLDRVFDLYVMANMQRVVGAHFLDKDDPMAGLRDAPYAPEVEGGKKRLRQSYAWLERWLGANSMPPHVSLVTCAAAPSLFYADWIEPIPDSCPRLKALRAELLALPPVVRCVEEARPYRPHFPLGAPDRD